ncbi:hypothetical protein GQ43DRAFT_441748 [Delitschia confertaspora ATCC 74209]|uniref:PLC-like phosphodiesterase n=1 Tax=Delitschia confertaspora ATCC 74209 TaxID=1513339 RepID=A0A9P4MP55_9PLEO|nr:hypothetical protein GQ43DRAFT_441748 [Delitschia confertaspora ATCC 74209]
MLLKSLLQTASLLPLFYTITSAQTACNNSPSLCSKAYNNITHLGAHDSAFLRDQSTSFSTAGNQYFNTTTQLAAGVRLLSAQIHKANGTNGGSEWHLCHTTCDLLDAGTLAKWLGEIKAWMDKTPNEVVTLLLVNSDNASGNDLGAEFTASGISKYAYAPPAPSKPPTTWPTLDSLISNNTRLITFVASLGTASSNYPYLLDEFTHVFENKFETTSPGNYSCQPDRPSDVSGQPLEALKSGRMFLQNHFLYSTQLFGLETPNTTYIKTTNGPTGTGSLGEQLGECRNLYGKAPTFVLVDFFNVGPALQSIDGINGVSGAVGRQSVSAEILEQGVARNDGTDKGAGVKRRASWGVLVLATGVGFFML